ncbi:Ethylene-insensitive protein 2 [Glycine soja]|nr:Ethylene-insensitive protein 2 [Glycine soja]
MEAETLSPNHPPSFLCQSLPAVVPMLLISTVYVDPGKWVATVEDGARFGFDLMAVMLIFNFAAIFCQYISARIGAITGKSLAQVLRSPIALLGFLLILFLANQTTTLTLSLGREVVVHGFLKLDIPGWLHFATIRVIAVLPVLYCVRSSGAEGMYQLLLSTQVLVALQLPSFVVPLFRVATSRSIMGVHKISQFLELLALMIFVGMLGLNIFVVVEMIFGNSDWASDLGWNVGSGVSVSFTATPLRSASVQLDAQTWNWDMPETLPNPPVVGEESYLTETMCHEDVSKHVEEHTPVVAKSWDYSDVITSKDTHSITSTSTSELEAVSTVVNEISDSCLEDTKTITMETNAERDDDDGDSWEAEEPSRVGIIDPAFLKPHSPLDPCFCLQVQRKLSPHLSNGMLPPTTKPGQGKYTTASTLLELIKEVKLAISGRKGRTGTAAGDVAFPKGKENFASVLKRYKQRLSNKPIGTNGGTGSRKIPTLAPYNQ